MSLFVRAMGAGTGTGRVHVGSVHCLVGLTGGFIARSLVIAKTNSHYTLRMKCGSRTGEGEGTFKMLLSFATADGIKARLKKAIQEVDKLAGKPPKDDRLLELKLSEVNVKVDMADLAARCGKITLGECTAAVAYRTSYGTGSIDEEAHFHILITTRGTEIQNIEPRGRTEDFRNFSVFLAIPDARKLLAAIS